MKFRTGNSAGATAAALTIAVVCACAILASLPAPTSTSLWKLHSPTLGSEGIELLHRLVDGGSGDSASRQQLDLAAAEPPPDGSDKSLRWPTSHESGIPGQPAPGSFSDEDRLLFASLPSMCTAELAGRVGEIPNTATEPERPAAAGAADELQDSAVANEIAQAWKSAFQPSLDNQLGSIPRRAMPVSEFDPTGHATGSRLPTRIESVFERPPGKVVPTSWHSAVESAGERPTTDTRPAPATGSFPPGLPHGSPTAIFPEQDPTSEDPHLEIYSRTPFPSARQCAKCHQQIYEEWASSSHAYASISPMFHVFEEAINRLSQGTIGYFCYRCHSPVSTTMGLRRDQPIWDGPQVFREGVTCVACHRVKIPYGKADGERRIEPGDLFDPVYGAGDGQGVAVVEKYKTFFNVTTDRQATTTPAQGMHRRAIQFEELSKSSFCMSCHQVAVEPGIKLEVVWDQYRSSPAYRQGISCQDCHMGKIPGVDAGYAIGPAAVVNGKVVQPERKHANHIFFGPGYSIAHPGIFPDHEDADRWTVPQWLEFDWRAGWGTEAFENRIADGQFACQFPPAWSNADDRYDARDIVDANLKKLEIKKDLRRQLLENGSQLDGPFFTEAPRVGQSLSFRYCVTNLNSGHNMPSGSLGAQPQIWMNVVLIAPDGQRLWETGYLDSHGDLADNHSLDVLTQRLPLDTQLMNLQTKFLTTNVKGTDREMYLPINFDVDQLPFLRPPQQPVSVLNHPPLIRMEQHSIPPLGKRNAKFSVPARLLQTPGTYRLSVRMRSRAEPIYFMRFCNATPEMERMMNEWICDFHVSTVVFDVH